MPTISSSKEKFILSTALAFLVVFSFYFAWQSLVDKIQRPFRLARAKALASLSTTTLNQEVDLQTLMNKDTDKDGLSDFDELYLYKTSPYLEDSDSDGILDAEEIKQGKDPNCPEGKDCKTGLVEGLSYEVSPTTSLDLSSFSATDLSNFLSQNLNFTPDELRKFLIAQGLSPEEVQKIDDATLMQIWQGALSKVTTSSQTQNIVNPSELLSDPKKVRELLKQSGISEEVLSKMSDQEILKIVQEIFKK